MNIKHYLAILVFMFACVGCGGEKVSHTPGPTPPVAKVNISADKNTLNLIADGPSQDIIIKNIGTEAMSIQPSVSSPVIAIASSSSCSGSKTISSGSTCTITLNGIKPTTNADLVITGSDNSKDTLTIPITVTPVTPPSKDFLITTECNEQQVPPTQVCTLTFPTSNVITIKNTGAETIASVTVSKSSPASGPTFTQSSLCAGSMTNNQSCSLTAKPPSANMLAGSYKYTITVKPQDTSIAPKTIPVTVKVDDEAGITVSTLRNTETSNPGGSGILAIASSGVDLTKSTF